jgi:hypothetical protein
MEAQPLRAKLLDRPAPDQPAEVAALQVGPPATREHQPSKAGQDKQRQADLTRDRLATVPLGQIGVWLILSEGAWSQSEN